MRLPLRWTVHVVAMLVLLASLGFLAACSGGDDAPPSDGDITTDGDESEQDTDDDSTTDDDDDDDITEDGDDEDPTDDDDDGESDGDEDEDDDLTEDGDEDDDLMEQEEESGELHEVLITAEGYDPTLLVIANGDRVRWVNRDSVNHTVTSGTPDRKAADGLFDSGQLAPGDDFVLKFTTDFHFQYFCRLHPSMTGEIYVNQIPADGDEDLVDDEEDEPEEDGDELEEEELDEESLEDGDEDGDEMEEDGDETEEDELELDEESGPQTYVIEIRNSSFSPASVELDVGDTVEFVNVSSQARRVVSLIPQKSGEIFDSGTLYTNQRYSFTFPWPGVFPYEEATRHYQGSIEVIGVALDGDLDIDFPEEEEEEELELSDGDEQEIEDELELEEDAEDEAEVEDGDAETLDDEVEDEAEAEEEVVIVATQCGACTEIAPGEFSCGDNYTCYHHDFATQTEFCAKHCNNPEECQAGYPCTDGLCIPAVTLQCNEDHDLAFTDSCGNAGVAEVCQPSAACNDDHLDCRPVTSEWDCNDGIDNNGNGYADCLDDDCLSEADCIAYACRDIRVEGCTVEDLSRNTSNFENDFSSYACFAGDFPGNDVVYFYTVPEACYALSATLSNFIGNYDLYALDQCDSTECGDRHSTGTTPVEQLDLDVEPGQELHFVVERGDGLTQNSPFNFEIACACPCHDTGLEITAEDIPFAVSSESNIGGENRFDSYECLAERAYPGPERIFRLTAPTQCPAYLATVNLTNVTNNALDLIVLKHCGTTDCGSNASINQDVSDETVIFPIGGGKDAFLVVDGYLPDGSSAGVTGSFDLDVTWSCVEDETDCFDEIDNDQNGQTDCYDAHCVATQASCQGEWNCTDEIDNDGNGLTDCEEGSCRATPGCRPPEVCNDGEDNNANGMLDCADLECRDSDLCPDSCFPRLTLFCGDSLADQYTVDDISTHAVDVYTCGGQDYTGYNEPEKTYYFTSTVNQTVTLTVTPYHQTLDFDVFVIPTTAEDDCFPSQCQYAGVTRQAGQPQELTFTALEGQSYQIVVDGYTGTHGVFHLGMECTP